MQTYTPLSLCDDLSVTRKDTHLIVTDFIETAGRNCMILKGCCAGQNSGCMHSEENIGKYECRDKSLSSPNVLPCTNVKLLSFLALNVCGILSKMKHPDLLCNRVYCIHVPGHDPLIFSFLSFSFLIGWEFYGPNYLRC